MPTTIDFLNAVRTELGYADRIPELNQSNLHELSHQPPEVLTEFIGVIGKIARQYVYSTVFDRSSNPFAEFFSEKLPVGMTVEDLYVDLIEGALPAWNDDGSTALSRKKPLVSACYHSVNWEMQYKVSTSFAQQKTAFLSVEGVENLTNRITQTLHSSAEYDIYLQCLELISTMIENQDIVSINIDGFDSETDYKSSMVTIKNTLDNMKFMNTKYNKQGFVTKTDSKDIIILMKPSLSNKISVDYLSGIFNLSKVEMQERIIYVPDDYGFGSLDDGTAQMVVLDKRALRIFPTLWEGSSIYNPAGLFTNTFLTNQFIFSYGLFFNAVVFNEGTEVVTP